MRFDNVRQHASRLNLFERVVTDTHSVYEAVNEAGNVRQVATFHSREDAVLDAYAPELCRLVELVVLAKQDGGDLLGCVDMLAEAWREARNAGLPYSAHGYRRA